jgi:hypothetical protein
VVKTFLIVHARGRQRHPGPRGASIMANAVCQNGQKRIPVDSRLALVFPEHTALAARCPCACAFETGE